MTPWIRWPFLVLTLLVIGFAGGWFGRQLTSTTKPAGQPPSTPISTSPSPGAADIKGACDKFLAALGDATASADRVNQEVDGEQLAHPYSASDVWKTKHQAALEEVVEIAEKVAEDDQKWFSVAYALRQAMFTMSPPPGSEPSARVDQEDALLNAEAACVGR